MGLSNLSPPRLFATPFQFKSPPAKKIRMEKGQKARAERRGSARRWAEWLESPQSPSVRFNQKPPRAWSVRLVISRIIAKICSNFF